MKMSQLAIGSYKASLKNHYQSVAGSLSNYGALKMKSITRGAFNIIKNRQREPAGSTLEMRQSWREAPLSDVGKIKIKAKIWLAGREASPLAGQGRHFRIPCEEVFGKRHYKRAFDGTKLSKIYRKLNFGHGLGKINNKPNRKFEAGTPHCHQR